MARAAVMSELLEALERVKTDFDFSAVADLWRTGYKPTAEEFAAFATFTIDKRQQGRKRVAAQARAVLRFKELRSNKSSVADAIALAAKESGLHVLKIENAIRGKNRAVNQLLAVWARRSAALGINSS
jgi:hypothetical protein